jgi:D-alanyl-D-alanine dipeptidase
MHSQLVDVLDFVPDIQIDLKYATEDNFTGRKIYSSNQCLLLKEIVLILKNVQSDLKKLGVRLIPKQPDESVFKPRESCGQIEDRKWHSMNPIQCHLRSSIFGALARLKNRFFRLFRYKIWDGFRPLVAQWKLWEICPNEQYVSNPRKGGRHTRGTSIDATLITTDLKEVPMPSKFDTFDERAHLSYKGASKEETQNRDLLQTIMRKHGFIGIETEWWHFDYKGWEQYPIIEC